MSDVCDFCSSPKVVRRYQCMDFDAASRDAGVLYVQDEGPTNVVLNSRNYWAACAECFPYVDFEDLEGLLTHIATLPDFLVLSPARRITVLVHLRHVYTLFFQNRIRVEA